MKDRIEDFIRENRGQFDNKEPNERIWKKIEQSLTFNKGTSLWNSVTIWRAAAIVFMVLSVYLLIPKNAQPRQQIALKEFADVEQFYVQQISEKTELIEAYERVEGYNGFTNDMKQLEAMYMVLKEEMRSRPSQKVKDALVLNLLVRIDLLNQQLNRLDEGEYDEKSEETKPGEKQKEKTNNA